MSAKTTSFTEPVENAALSVNQTISETSNQVKDKVSDLGRSAADKIDENRGAAASGLEKAASALHENAEGLPGGEKVTSLAHATADKLSSTADYVRGHDVNRVMTDVGTLVKNSNT